MRKITETDYLIDIEEDFPKREYFDTNRYNGGWVKEITGINKTKSNGYSLIGPFVENGKEGSYRVTNNKLYLDCNIAGSRKRHDKQYTLFTIKDGKLIILHDESMEKKENKNWAINMWPSIESHLNNMQKIDKDKFFGFTDTELINELSSRGYDVSALKDLRGTTDKFRNIELDNA